MEARTTTKTILLPAAIQNLICRLYEAVVPLIPLAPCCLVGASALSWSIYKSKLLKSWGRCLGVASAYLLEFWRLACITIITPVGTGLAGSANVDTCNSASSLLLNYFKFNRKSQNASVLGAKEKWDRALKTSQVKIKLCIIIEKKQHKQKI